MSTPMPGGVQRHHDVAEQDRRVHPVPAHRLQGDLADQLRGQAGLQHAGVGPQRPVLRQRAAGLPHEPHRHRRRACRRGRRPAAGRSRARGAPAARAATDARVRRTGLGGVMTAGSDARHGRADRPATVARSGRRRASVRRPELRPRVPARARPDRSTSAVPAGGRLAARRAAPAGAASCSAARRAAPAGAYTWAFSVEADAGRPGRGPRRARHVRAADPAARPGTGRTRGRARSGSSASCRRGSNPEQLGDEMLPVVGWSWLTEALDDRGAEYVALGGTVTQTSSVRFGDIAGPRRDDDVELRASWTPVGHRSDAGTPRRSAAWSRPPPGCRRSGAHPSLNRG